MAEEPEPTLEIRPLDPWTTRPKENSITRLVTFDYRCPLCEGIHSPDFYFTVATTDENVYAEEIRRILYNDGMVETLVKVAIKIHASDGDLEQLVNEVMERKQTATGVVSHTILEESQYTCDACTQTFPTIAELRLLPPKAATPNSAPDYKNLNPVSNRSQ